MWSRPLIITATLAAIIPTVLAACATADLMPGALPLGIADQRVPTVDTNAYIYISAPATLALTSNALSVDALAVASAEVLLMSVGREFATRLTFDESNAPEDAPSPGAGGWTVWDERNMRAGPNTPWGIRVREAWEQDARAPFGAQFPAAWAQLQELPADPPATPVASGFVRNFGGLIAEVIEPAGASIPSLGDGLALVRVDRVVFAVYANDLAVLPNGIAPGVLANHGLSVLAVAQSTYPGAVVGQVYGGFVSALGLAPVEFDGVTAHYREAAPDLHIVVLRAGATIFFAMSATRLATEALIQAVVRDQAARE
jgi:hypothetical protein